MFIKKTVLFLILVSSKNMLAGMFKPVERFSDKIVAVYIRTQLQPELLNNLFAPTVSPTTTVTKSNLGVYTVHAWEWHKISSLLAVARLVHEPNDEIVNELKNRIAIFETAE